MESTAQKRIFHAGPPPHVGWWNASVCKDRKAWRWWDGKEWSCAAMWFDTVGLAAAQAARYQTAAHKGRIEWSDYWPENARVPRIDPRVPA